MPSGVKSNVRRSAGHRFLFNHAASTIMIERIDSPKAHVLGFILSGKLHDEDYEQFVPVVEAAIEAHGKIRLLAELVDFHGWDLPALWDDLKFATNHCTQVERVAIVGDSRWEKWMTKICQPFTLAGVRYFDVSHQVAAWAWIEEKNEPASDEFR